MGTPLLLANTLAVIISFHPPRNYPNTIRFVKFILTPVKLFSGMTGLLDVFNSRRSYTRSPFLSNKR
jgi:hypothetical protein